MNTTKPRLVRGIHYTIDQDGDVFGNGDWQILQNGDEWIWEEQANTTYVCWLKRGRYNTRTEALEAVLESWLKYGNRDALFV